MRLITAFKRWKYRSALKQLQSSMPPHRSRPHNLNTVKKLTVLFVADSLESRRAMEKLAEQRRAKSLHTELFGYVDSKEVPEGTGAFLFGPADLNWYGSPKPDLLTRWTKKESEILLVLIPQLPPLFQFLTLSKRTELRVGPYDERVDNPFDIQYMTNRKDRAEQLLDRSQAVFQIANAQTSTSI